MLGAVLMAESCLWNPAQALAQLLAGANSLFYESHLWWTNRNCLAYKSARNVHLSNTYMFTWKGARCGHPATEVCRSKPHRTRVTAACATLCLPACSPTGGPRASDNNERPRPDNRAAHHRQRLQLTMHVTNIYIEEEASQT